MWKFLGYDVRHGRVNVLRGDLRYMGTAHTFTPRIQLFMLPESKIPDWWYYYGSAAGPDYRPIIWIGFC